MSNIRFFQCKECGLMAASLNDKVIPNLNELIPNTVEASGEKHKPVVKVEGDKVSRTKPVCPKCGPGVFMATHKDRVACGCCGYTEFKN